MSYLGVVFQRGQDQTSIISRKACNFIIVCYRKVSSMYGQRRQSLAINIYLAPWFLKIFIAEAGFMEIVVPCPDEPVLDAGMYCVGALIRLWVSKSILQKSVHALPVRYEQRPQGSGLLVPKIATQKGLDRRRMHSFYEMICSGSILSDGLWCRELLLRKDRPRTVQRHKLRHGRRVLSWHFWLPHTRKGEWREGVLTLVALCPTVD
jgi:hypothetical protein